MTMATEDVTVEDAIVRAAAADVKAMLLRLAETEAAKDGRPVDDQADPVVVVWIPGAEQFLAVRVKALLDVVFEEPLRDVRQLEREIAEAHERLDEAGIGRTITAAGTTETLSLYSRIDVLAAERA
jgi:hypothetical protein